MNQSYSQVSGGNHRIDYRHDLIFLDALSETPTVNKRHGFFVDLATNHYKNDSNTFLLEQFYNWNGLCI
jgi:hypothetical protein